LSQQIERVALGWRTWRRSLLGGAGFDENPFSLVRQATTRQAFRIASSLSASDPLREPLRRWVYRLLEQRINRDWLVEVRRLGSVEIHPLESPLGGESSLAEMLRRAVAEPSRRSAWLEAWGTRTSGLSSAAGRLWQRRLEIARGLELERPDQIESPADGITELARAWLEASSDLWAALRVRDLRRYLDVASGSGAAEGWPAKLTSRSVAELVGGREWLTGARWDPGRMPPALVPASFLRGLARAGAAWGDALAPRDQPFVVAHDPYGLRRRMLGAIWGTLPLEPEFVRRRLSVPAFQRSAHVRALAGVVLAEARRNALAVLLRDAALRGPRAWAEELPTHSRQALGATLRPEWAGAIVRLHVDSPQRFAAVLLAAERIHALREAHDSDWFRNPRAIEELGAEAGSPPAPSVARDRLERARGSLLGWLARALG
jgi:hypothetical protein